MMVIRRGEQLQQALRLLQEVTEWSIAGQLARVNAGHLEEEEVARRLHQVTLGARGPGTSDYMLRTLRSLVKFTWLLIGNNISGTFQM